MAWFADWFNTPYYHILYQNRDYAEAENFIKALTDYLHLPAGARFVDLACGRGRHGVFLHQLGYKVLGLDLSEKSIAYAQESAQESLQFAVHDMREEMPVAGQDAVINLFTSFGYFEEAADDVKVFSAVAKALKNDGFFVLDFLNERYVRKHLVPQETLSRGEIQFEISREIAADKIIKDIRFQDNGQSFHYQEVVQLKTLQEIERLGAAQGLQVQDVFGDYHLGKYLPENSPRCLVIFQKES